MESDRQPLPNTFMQINAEMSQTGNHFDNGSWSSNTVPGGAEFQPMPGRADFQPMQGIAGYQPMPGIAGYQSMPGRAEFQPMPYQETHYRTCQGPRHKTLDISALHDNLLTPEIAIDCEMVEAMKDHKRFSVVARVSIVNSECQTLLDTYVKTDYYISDFRTRFSGIQPHHLVDAPDYLDVREFVLKLVRNRTIVGHDLKQDLAVLGIDEIENQLQTQDTSVLYMSYFKPKMKPSLKKLALAVLSRQIQNGAHDSIEDARMSMELYKRWRDTKCTDCAECALNPS